MRCRRWRRGGVGFGGGGGGGVGGEEVDGGGGAGGIDEKVDSGGDAKEEEGVDDNDYATTRSKRATGATTTMR